jgi:hypothetical protein
MIDWPQMILSIATLLGVVLNYLVQRKIHTAVNGNAHAAIAEIKALKKEVASLKKLGQP